MGDATTLVDAIEGAMSRAESRSTPDMRVVRRSLNRECQAETVEALLAAAGEVIKRGKAPRWFVYELVHYHPGAVAGLNVRTLEQLGEGLDGWGETDPFGCYLSGPAWRERRIRDATVHKWAKSSDRWWRRVAAVSTVPLNCTARGGTGDPERTFGVCELLAGDRDEMIVKALSWALRELSTKCPELVAAYVDDNRQILPARVVREVRNKLNTGLKNPGID